MKCPKCLGNESVKFGKARGKQRYRCKKCGFQFTSERMRARSTEEKLFAMTLFVSGLSLYAVAKILDVSPQTVSRWKNSGLINSEKVIRALRVRKVLRSGKIYVLKENDERTAAVDDFKYGDVYSLETRLPSGIRVDFVVKRKNITK